MCNELQGGAGTYCVAKVVWTWLALRIQKQGLMTHCQSVLLLQEHVAQNVEDLTTLK